MTTYIVGLNLGAYIVLVCIILILMGLCLWYYILKPLHMEPENESQEILEMDSLSRSHPAQN